MNIISHGLWGGVAFGRKRTNLYWWAFLFGILPDLTSFGLYMVGNVLGLISGVDWSNGLPTSNSIPEFVHTLYNYTHSLIIFGVIFCAVWALQKKPFIPMLAWGLHILMDIPTHSIRFFPTPFLWPFSNFAVNGINWSQPIIFYSDIILLVVVYAFWWSHKRRAKRNPPA